MLHNTKRDFHYPHLFALYSFVAMMICVQTSFAEINFMEELKSPISSQPARSILLYGFGSGLILYTVFKDPYMLDIQKKVQDSKPLEKYYDTLDLMGRMLPNGIYLASYYLYGRMNKDKRSLLRSEKMLKATLYSGAVTTILKQIFREQRPGGSHDRKSFPSGHATVVFAFAGVVSYEHPWYAGVAATSLAALVGLQRMGRNAHYLHDVIAGGAIGFAFGVGMSAYLDKKNGMNSNSSFNIVPTFEKDSSGLMALYKYKF